MAPLNHQKQGDLSYCNGQCRQNNVHNGQTCNGQYRQREFYSAMDILAKKNHCVCRHEIDFFKKPTNFSFHLYKQNNSQTNERKSTLDQELLAYESISRLEPVAYLESLE